MGDKYRLTRGKLFRIQKRDGDPTPGLIKFVKDDVLIPSATELQIFRSRLDGPVRPDTPLTIEGVVVREAGSIAVAEQPERVMSEAPAIVTAVSDTEKAQQILKQPDSNMREAVRHADDAFLELLANTESLREKPRRRVLEMIDRRRKRLAK